MSTPIRDLYSPSPSPLPKSGFIKLTNCRLFRNSQLIDADLWLSCRSGRILNGQTVFFTHRAIADRVIDLGSRIVSPGFIDVQTNGSFGVDFSVPGPDSASYVAGLEKFNTLLVATGVTSYLPTIVSQNDDVYHKVLPFLCATGRHRDAHAGAESLGAHCEGPFLNPTKNGIHNVEFLRAPANGFADLETCYGADNLTTAGFPIKCVTLAPEQSGALDCIVELRSRGIAVSIGHSEATFEEASAAVDAGATMITHLFNAMRPLHHRSPGVFGVLGRPAPPAVPKPVDDPTAAPKTSKPFFGIIADGIHLHPSSVNIAWSSHPDGCILVTDAMSLAGLADGVYDWTNGAKIRKAGLLLTLEGTDGTIAGSAVSLIECANNFLAWTGASIPAALAAVTSTPARMLGCEKIKGTLETGGDADLVVLDEVEGDDGAVKLVVEQVWKFGVCVYDAQAAKAE